MKLVALAKLFTPAPETQPAALRAKAVDVDAAALALAHLNGEDGATLPPTIRDRYRNTAILAAMLIDPADSKLVAYLVEGEMSREFERWTDTERRSEMTRLMRAIREATVVLSGARPRVLSARQSLLASDDAAPKFDRRSW